MPIGSKADVTLDTGRVILSSSDFKLCLGVPASLPLIGVIEQTPQLQYNDSLRKSCVRFYVRFLESTPGGNVSSREEHVTVMCNVTDPPFAGMGQSLVTNVRVDDVIVFQNFKLPKEHRPMQYVWSRNASNIQWYRIEIPSGEMLSQRVGGRFTSAMSLFIERWLQKRLQQRRAAEAKANSNGISQKSNSPPKSDNSGATKETQALAADQREVASRIDKLEAKATSHGVTGESLKKRVHQLESDFVVMYSDVEKILGQAIDRLSQVEDRCRELETKLAANEAGHSQDRSGEPPRKNRNTGRSS